MVLCAACASSLCGRGPPAEHGRCGGRGRQHVPLLPGGVGPERSVCRLLVPLPRIGARRPGRVTRRAVALVVECPLTERSRVALPGLAGTRLANLHAPGCCTERSRTRAGLVGPVGSQGYGHRALDTRLDTDAQSEPFAPLAPPLRVVAPGYREGGRVQSQEQCLWACGRRCRRRDSNLRHSDYDSRPIWLSHRQFRAGWTAVGHNCSTRPPALPRVLAAKPRAIR